VPISNTCGTFRHRSCLTGCRDFLRVGNAISRKEPQEDEEHICRINAIPSSISEVAYLLSMIGLGLQLVEESAFSLAILGMTMLYGAGVK
jgi:hypothetical protein